ncbi:hypothetical protein MY3957_000658 [Beauveria namnaoensis]
MAAQKPAQEDRQVYMYIDGVENLDRYDKGGYHPITIGDILNKRYTIVDKLGYGGYSTVWVARDMQQEKYIALKIGVAKSRMHEISIMKSLSDLRSSLTANPVSLSGFHAIPRLLDDFTIHGPNGEHPSYTTDLAGSNLDKSLNSGMFRTDVARALAVKLVSAIAYMHGRGYVHGGMLHGRVLRTLHLQYLTPGVHLLDIHLGNVMLRLPTNLSELSVDQFYEKYGHPQTITVSRVDSSPVPPNLPVEAVYPLNLGKAARNVSIEETNLLLVDFGESFAPASTFRPCEECRSQKAGQPPETYFEPSSPFTFSADIWCLGLVIWELFSIRPLFGSSFLPRAALIAQNVDVLGPLPARWWSVWKERHNYFDENGNSIQGENAFHPLPDVFDETVQGFRTRHKAGTLSVEEKSAFLRLMRRMLSVDPLQRASAAEVLESDWVKNWAMHDFEKSWRSSRKIKRQTPVGSENDM